MGLLSLEHSAAAYRADFVVHATVVVSLAAWVLLRTPQGERWPVALAVALGLVGWTLIEYFLHRFILHGPPPFRHWHARHHQRPTAFIVTPTLMSLGMIAGLVFLPALLATSLWPACGFALGVLIGYLAYTVMHHATHHWRAGNRWLMHRKRWHALHHHAGSHPGYYGVTTSVWDHVFGTARR